MKKLMFAAAAIAVGIAVADVTSANIVGYAQFEDALAGWAGTMVTPQFISVGASEAYTFKAKDLTPIAPDEDPTDSIEIQILNDDGTCNPENDLNWDGTKWVYYGTSTDASEKVVDAGTGLWILSNIETSYFQSSGEVGKKAVTAPLAEYAGAAAGNPFPAEFTFATVTPMMDPDVGDDLADNIEVQILNDDGTCDPENDLNWDGAKWVYYGTSNDASEKVLKKGIGLWVLTNCGGASLFIPVPASIQAL